MLLQPLPFPLLDFLWCNFVSCGLLYPGCFWRISFRSCLFLLKTFFGGNKKLWLTCFENIIFKSSSPIYLLSFNISWKTPSTITKMNIMCLQNTLRPFFLESAHVQLGAVQICTRKNDRDLQLFAIWNYFFNEWISTIFRIFMDSKLPSAWWQRLFNKFVAFNVLLLGRWQPLLSRSLETRFAGMPLSFPTKSNMFWPIFSAILKFFYRPFSHSIW